IAVRCYPDRTLESGDGFHGARTEQPVDLAVIEALGAQALLDLLAFGAAQRPVVARPASLDAGTPGDPLAKEGYPEGVIVRIVVAQDRAEIVEDQEGRTFRSRRHDDRTIARRQAAAAHPP